MATRNFYVNCQIDGRTNMLSGGPQRKDGGFDMSILMRDDGGRRTVLHIMGRASDKGNLELSVMPDDGQPHLVFKTSR